MSTHGFDRNNKLVNVSFGSNEYFFTLSMFFYLFRIFSGSICLRFPALILPSSILLPVVSWIRYFFWRKRDEIRCGAINVVTSEIPNFNESRSFMLQLPRKSLIYLFCFLLSHLFISIFVKFCSIHDDKLV